MYDRKYNAGTATVDFKLWNFQDQFLCVYCYMHTQRQSHTRNHCFYSKQAMHLVVFGIVDGKSGIEESDTYLRNIKVCYDKFSSCIAIHMYRHKLLAVIIDTV